MKTALATTLTNAIAQTAPEVVDTATNVAAAVPAAAVELSYLQWFAKFMIDGGAFMFIIAFVWAVAVAIVIERVKKLYEYDTDGGGLMIEIKKLVLANQVHDAIKLCSDKLSLLPQVLRSGLKRANGSKEQITDSLETGILEVIPNLNKRLSYLSLTANLSTLLGLLGTIQGLIQSFAAVSSASPEMKAQLLASGISTAMNTTALGLVSAISIMIIHSILVSKTEKIQADLEHYSLKLVELLSTKKITARPNELVADL